MNHVSLEDAKRYSRVYHSADDVAIEKFVAAAEAWLAKFWGYDSIGDDELLIDPGQEPPPDSPGAAKLKPDVELCVLMVADDFYQQRGTSVVGTIVTANPTFMRVAHLYRRDLGV